MVLLHQPAILVLCRNGSTPILCIHWKCACLHPGVLHKNAMLRESPQSLRAAVSSHPHSSDVNFFTFLPSKRTYLAFTFSHSKTMKISEPEKGERTVYAKELKRHERKRG